MTNTYIAFDADSDMTYYRTLQMWKNNNNIDFDFVDIHELNNLRPDSSEETIKTKLRERMKESELFILLVGRSTKNLYKYVRWEIDLAIEKGLPIIVCNLNEKRTIDSDLCPAILKNKLAIHISFKAKIISHAHKNWKTSYYTHKINGASEAYLYPDETYEGLGLNESDTEKKMKALAALRGSRI